MYLADFFLWISLPFSLIVCILTQITTLCKKKKTPFFLFVLLNLVGLILLSLSRDLFPSFLYDFCWDWDWLGSILLFFPIIWHAILLIRLGCLRGTFCCPKCKKEVSRSSDFCPKCGENLHAEPTPAYNQSSLRDK